METFVLNFNTQRFYTINVKLICLTFYMFILKKRLIYFNFFIYWTWCQIKRKSFPSYHFPDLTGYSSGTIINNSKNLIYLNSDNENETTQTIKIILIIAIMLSTTQKVSKHYDCDNDDDNNRKIIKNNNNKKLSNFLISITSHLYCLEMFHWLRTFSPAYSKVYCSIQTEFYKAFSRYSKFQKKHFTISYLLSVWFFSNLYYTRSFLVHSLHSRVSLPHWINVITVVFCTLRYLSYRYSCEHPEDALSWIVLQSINLNWTGGKSVN